MEWNTLFITDHLEEPWETGRGPEGGREGGVWGGVGLEGEEEGLVQVPEEAEETKEQVLLFDE